MPSAVGGERGRTARVVHHRFGQPVLREGFKIRTDVQADDDIFFGGVIDCEGPFQTGLRKSEACEACGAERSGGQKASKVCACETSPFSLRWCKAGVR